MVNLRRGALVANSSGEAVGSPSIQDRVVVLGSRLIWCRSCTWELRRMLVPSLIKRLRNKKRGRLRCLLLCGRSLLLLSATSACCNPHTSATKLARAPQSRTTTTPRLAQRQLLLLSLLPLRLPSAPARLNAQCLAIRTRQSTFSSLCSLAKGFEAPGQRGETEADEADSALAWRPSLFVRRERAGAGSLWGRGP